MQALKVLLSQPLQVIFEDKRIKQQDYYKRQVSSRYRSGSLPTIEILDLLLGLSETVSR